MQRQRCWAQHSKRVELTHLPMAGAEERHWDSQSYRAFDPRLRVIGSHGRTEQGCGGV